MKPYQTVCLTLFLMPLPALACSQMQPTAAFITINDANRDGGLNLEEWMQAQTGGNLETDFILRDEAEFRRLDFNGDGHLQAREIGFRSVRYIEQPCARFEAMRKQHATKGFMHTAR